MLHELWSDVRYRARALFRSGAMERELDTELRFHIEQQAAEFERRGTARDEARRQAQQTRDARGTAFAESLLRDLRYALRILRKEPGFSLTVVLILGLGIGANVATFTVFDALMLRQLPCPIRRRWSRSAIRRPSAPGGMDRQRLLTSRTPSSRMSATGTTSSQTSTPPESGTTPT